MKYLKLVLFIAIITNAVSIAFAEDTKSALAIEYLELSKTKETFDSSIDSYVNQLSSKTPHANKAQLRAFFNSYMGWEILKERAIKVVAEIFTEDELRAINDFYKSKYGIVYADKSPALSAAISEIISANLTKVIPKMQQK